MAVLPTEPPSPQKPKIAVVVTFLNEAEFLPRLLATFERQTVPPTELLLVDDGSSDNSAAIAAAFTDRHPYARALTRRQRPTEHDRLANAPELGAFMWGVEMLSSRWDVVAKMDGDLELPPTLLEEVAQAFVTDPRLGITGGYLCSSTGGRAPRRENTPPYHVRGCNKFYRRECFDQIMPLPPMLGWDTIDDLRARSRGWRTHSFVPRSGEIVHLRPTGAYDGQLRAFTRWGRCAWACGVHPLWVAAGALKRALAPPYVVGGVGYLSGWMMAGIGRRPRAEAELLEYSRREDLRRIRARARAALRRAAMPRNLPEKLL